MSTNSNSEGQSKKPNSNSGNRKKNNNRRRNNRRNNYKSKASGNQKAEASGENKSARPPRSSNNSKNSNNRNNNKRHHHKKRHNHRRRRKTFVSGLKGVFKKYDTLLSLHNKARKEYFEKFHRVDDNGRKKLEDLYDKTIRDLREFEATLSEEDRKSLNECFVLYEEDKVYSSNHALTSVGIVEVAQEYIEDPHLKDTQKQANYKDDTEESVGSIEDYKKYKGL